MALKVIPSIADEITSLCGTTTTDVPTVADLSREKVFGIGHTANPVPIFAIRVFAQLN